VVKCTKLSAKICELCLLTETQRATSHRALTKIKKTLCIASFLVFLGVALVPRTVAPLCALPTIYYSDGGSCMVALFHTFSLQSYYAYLWRSVIVACLCYPLNRLHSHLLGLVSTPRVLTFFP